MKRAIAILAVLVIFSGAALPELSAGQPQGNLPSCCRQNGKHMCVVLRERKTGIGRDLETPRVAALCPLWGQTRQIAITQRPVPNLSRPAIFSALQGLLGPIAIAGSAAPLAPFRNISLRGPPPLS